MTRVAVRREKVILDLESNLPEGMLRGAAATEILRKELDRLSGVSVQTSRATANISRDIDKMDGSAKRADNSINQLTGRLRLFADAAAILGPALAPLGGVAIAGMAGLASQMGFAAVAGGVLIGSLKGVGDALSALNDAHLEPTAENLTKAEDALNRLSPAAADFAREAYGLLPVLRGIRDAGAEGLFPGLTDSLDDLERLAPVVANIFSQVGTALGDIASGGAASLASDRWASFFEFIAAEAPRALSELASAVGSVTHGLAELWMAFAPLNRDVSGWLVDIADGFDSWASGLAQTEGFRDFLAYIQTTGPQVSDTLGALANAVVQIVQAASPLGGAVLAGIEGLANALSAIADSGFGPALLGAATALAVFTRGMALWTAASTAGLAALNPWVLGIGATAGVLLAVEQKADAAATSIERFNEAIKAGDMSEAQAGIAEMQKRLDALKGTDMAGITFSSIGNLFEGKSVQDEIDALTSALAGSKGAVAGLKDEQERAASSDAYRNSIEAETAALEKNIGMMRAKRDEALRSFSAQTNYSQSLLDSKKALEENGRAWGLNSEAGLKNRRVVEQQASSWNELNRTQGQTPEQARKARKALEDTAVSLGASREEARRYANQLMDIPNDLKTKIGLDVDTAMQRAKAIKAELASIDRNIDIYVNVRKPNASNFGPQITSADGATVPGQRYPYGDKIHALLAPGEEVISNRYGQADRHRALLKDINANRLANGGTAGKRKSAGGLFVADNTAALEEAIRRLTDTFEIQGNIVERDIASRDEWASKMSDVAKATVAGFNTGLFDSSSNPWASGAGGGALGNVNKDIAGLQQRDIIQQQLAGMGITGNALATILAEGNNQQIQSLISSGQAQAVAAGLDQRSALQASVGAAGGQFAFGAEFAAANTAAINALAEQQRMNVQLAGMQGQLVQVQAAIDRAAERAPEAFADALNGASGHAARGKGGK